MDKKVCPLVRKSLQEFVILLEHLSKILGKVDDVDFALIHR